MVKHDSPNLNQKHYTVSFIFEANEYACDDHWLHEPDIFMDFYCTVKTHPMFYSDNEIF